MSTQADLHMHSTFSDGQYSWKEICKSVLNSDLKLFSVTDHDCIDFYKQKLPSEIIDKLLNGVEITTQYKGKSVHLLVYNFEINDPHLNKLLKELNTARKQRIQNIFKRLESSGFDLHYNKQKEITTSAEIADILVENSYVESRSKAYVKILKHNEFPELSYDLFPTLQKVLEILSKSKKLLFVIAHPGFQFYLETKLIEEMFELGIHGLEVYHYSHNRKQRLYFRRLCKQWQKIVTGGSDFHGNSLSPHKIGKFGLDFHQLKNFTSKAKLNFTFSDSKILL
ncbi:MAG: hypothetical protein COB02_08300 [Candidatus Cloacimonadota bacterium]|nr:MAG: hypothetical protein COB02_08300 [Candidatus Cloacimonadota bacterium]